jgi:hypothetical protein
MGLPPAQPGAICRSSRAPRHPPLLSLRLPSSCRPTRALLGNLRTFLDTATSLQGSVPPCAVSDTQVRALTIHGHTYPLKSPALFHRHCFIGTVLSALLCHPIITQSCFIVTSTSEHAFFCFIYPEIPNFKPSRQCFFLLKPLPFLPRFDHFVLAKFGSQCKTFDPSSQWLAHPEYH